MITLLLLSLTAISLINGHSEAALFTGCALALSGPLEVLIAVKG